MKPIVEPSSASDIPRLRPQLLDRYRELVDRKFTRGLTRREASELSRLKSQLDAEDAPRVEELKAGFRNDRELLRKSINDLLTFARQLKVK